MGPIWRCGLFFSRTLSALFIALLRAQEKIRILNIFTFINKAGSALFGILVLFVILYLTGQQAEVKFLLAGNLLWEGFFAALFFFLIVKKGRLFFIQSYDFVLSKSLLFFSLPLLFSELANITLNFADRYLILFYLDASAVALYAVPYNLAMYLGQGVVIPLGQAVFPVYTRLYEEQGKDATRELLSRLFKYYVMLAVIILAISFFIGEELLVLLASNKYREAGMIFPWIVLGVLINGTVIFFSAGSYLAHKTKNIAWATLVGAIFNALSNFVFIPLWGLKGAAYATALSYGLVIILIGFFSFRYLRISFYFRHSGFCIATAIALYFIFEFFLEGKGLVMNVFGALCMFVSYCLLMLFDPKVKRMSYQFVQKFIKKQ